MTTSNTSNPTAVNDANIPVVEAEPVTHETALQNAFNPSVPQADSFELSPLTKESLAHFSPEEQTAIKEVADKIDVLQLEKVMTYGQAPLIQAFEEAGRILELKQGTAADQEVIQQVIELSKTANENYNDFNLAIQEPGFLQKILLKLSTAAKEKHDNEVKVKAITNHKLLAQLRESCESWLATLQESFGSISASIENDKSVARQIEMYIVAGKIAEERITQELAVAKSDYDISGFLSDKDKYDSMKEGLDTFRLSILNLEKSRVASHISVAQLYLERQTNKNVQMAVITQKNHSMAVASQQLRNAVYGAENSIAIKGQKSVTGLNSELMKKVSENISLTAEESEQILLNGIYTTEAGLVAAKTVVDGCKKIEAAREQRVSKIEADVQKLTGIMAELAPTISQMKTTTGLPNNGNKTSATPTTSSSTISF